MSSASEMKKLREAVENISKNTKSNHITQYVLPIMAILISFYIGFTANQILRAQTRIAESQERISNYQIQPIIKPTLNDNYPEILSSVKFTNVGADLPSIEVDASAYIIFYYRKKFKSDNRLVRIRLGNYLLKTNDNNKERGDIKLYTASDPSASTKLQQDVLSQLRKVDYDVISFYLMCYDVTYTDGLKNDRNSRSCANAKESIVDSSKLKADLTISADLTNKSTLDDAKKLTIDLINEFYGEKAK